MANSFDPKELKILSDILALVIEEPKESASNILDTLRLRAKRNSITGGTLKNIFIQLANDQTRQDFKRQNAQLISRIHKLERELESSKNTLRSFQSAFHQSQQKNSSLQNDLLAQRVQRSWRYVTIIIGFAAGLLIGVASTEFYHTLTDKSPVDRSVYFR
ncbi:hypothetical protein [Swingsia samuiensis]|uniref:Uncharacterized protein n=1 Tax=Swingsia samuiensis TaxID=1293412 RepID=A0A4Y6UHA7_9PROT|nr:hypothetical protein [Swingsia samuiensis]QDH16414.1 hypothetical protein E3D00_01650 [Swingsia samuiensis]